MVKSCRLRCFITCRFKQTFQVIYYLIVRTAIGFRTKYSIFPELNAFCLLPCTSWLWELALIHYIMLKHTMLHPIDLIFQNNILKVFPWRRSLARSSVISNIISVFVVNISAVTLAPLHSALVSCPYFFTVTCNQQVKKEKLYCPKSGSGVLVKVGGSLGFICCLRNVVHPGWGFLRASRDPFSSAMDDAQTPVDERNSSPTHVPRLRNRRVPQR